MRTLTDRLESIRLKNHEMLIDQMNGVHLQLPQIATTRRLTVWRTTATTLRVSNAIPVAIDQVIERVAGGPEGWADSATFLLEKTVVQCATLADAAGGVQPLRRAGGPHPGVVPGGRSPSNCATPSSRPSMARSGPPTPGCRRSLPTEYAPRGREEFGVWSLPDGDARYRFAIHTQTTTKLSGAQIHDIGLAQVADLENQITALARTAGYADRKSFEKAVFSDPKLHGTSRQQILDRFTHYHRADGAEAAGALRAPAEEQTDRNQRPGLHGEGELDAVHRRYARRVTAGPGLGCHLRLTPRHDMLDDEATAYHEGVPGHHMQISIAQELPGLHPFHRALADDYNAYVEGWALYSERLGKEVGFYQDPASDLGRLRSELYRALRLVVDTGVHAKHWSRQQMVDYWNLHLPPASEAEMDRYIAGPARRWATSWAS